jgi:hypothetical protein
LASYTGDEKKKINHREHKGLDTKGYRDSESEINRKERKVRKESGGRSRSGKAEGNKKNLPQSAMSLR